VLLRLLNYLKRENYRSIMENFKAKMKIPPTKEIFKGFIFAIFYFFIMILIGVLIVSIYNHFYPIDVTSNSSVISGAIIFASFIVIEFGLLFFNKPPLTSIVIAIVILPILVIYKQCKKTDLKIDWNIPKKLSKQLPF